MKKENVSVIVSLLIVIGLIILVVIYLMNKPIKVNNVENNMELSLGDVPKVEEITNNNIEEQKTPLTNNMEEQKIQVAKNGDILSMNYTGRLQNGTVFDSNVDPKFNHVEPFEFTLGAGQVIVGWDEGLVGMKVGEKKTLTIAPEKAYGNRAIGSIPANSTLIFDVELVSIK